MLLGSEQRTPVEVFTINKSLCCVLDTRSSIEIETEASLSTSFLPSPSLLLLITYYGRKCAPGWFGASPVLGWNNSQERQGWVLEASNKTTQSARLGSRKSESFPELNQQLPIWASFHSLLSPNTHAHVYPSCFDKRVPQNREMIYNMLFRQKTWLLAHSFNSSYWVPTAPELADTAAIKPDRALSWQSSWS